MQKLHLREQPSAIFTYALWVAMRGQARVAGAEDVVGGVADQHALDRVLLAGAQHGAELEHVARAEEVIDLGHLLGELLGVALREAAGDHELLAAARSP